MGWLRSCPPFPSWFLSHIMETLGKCAGLIEKSPPHRRLTYMNTWFPSVWGGAFLEEGHHCGQALRFYRQTPLPVLSLCFLCVDDMWCFCFLTAMLFMMDTIPREWYIQQTPFSSKLLLVIAVNISPYSKSFPLCIWLKAAVFVTVSIAVKRPWKWQYLERKTFF